MERNLADRVIARYNGFLVDSVSERASDISVEVVRLNDLLVKVHFTFDERAFSFRAMLSDQEEGIMMLVEERVARDYILSGLGGSVFRKPNVHGGRLAGSGSLFFHVAVHFFNGTTYNFHFRGKLATQKQMTKVADHLP